MECCYKEGTNYLIQTKSQSLISACSVLLGHTVVISYTQEMFLGTISLLREIRFRLPGSGSLSPATVQSVFI